MQAKLRRAGRRGYRALFAAEMRNPTFHHGFLVMQGCAIPYSPKPERLQWSGIRRKLICKHSVFIGVVPYRDTRRSHAVEPLDLGTYSRVKCDPEHASS